MATSKKHRIRSHKTSKKKKQAFSNFVMRESLGGIPTREFFSNISKVFY